MDTATQVSFDPYHKWLGIREKQRPVNHYRLLGLELFEDDQDVIRDAASRLLTHVRTFRSGPYRGLSEMIVDELVSARSTLLDPHQKSMYDGMLRLQLSITQAGASASQPPLLGSSATTEKCPECGRENSSDRKYCTGCGSLLWGACLHCGAMTALAEQHCGHCGADLHVLIKARVDEINGRLELASSLRQQRRYQDAIELLELDTSDEHPRLVERQRQAIKLTAEIKLEVERLEGHAVQARQSAERAIANHDYQRAAGLIESLPEQFAGAEGKALFETAQSRHGEVTELLALIRQRIASKQLDGLLEKVERFLELKPDHGQMRQLRGKLLPLEQKKLESQRDQLSTNALEELAKHNYTEAARLLEQVPERVVTPEVEKLLNTARSKAAEVDWLVDDLQHAVVLDEHLPAIAQRLVQLKPDDPGAKLFVEKLQRHAQAAAAGKAPSTSQWPAPPAGSCWGFPLQALKASKRILAEAGAEALSRHAGSFGAALGLALQGLQLTPVNANLLPADKSGLLGRLKLSLGKKHGKSAWGLDIGRYALKAVKLVQADSGVVTAQAAEYIEHERAMNRPDVDPAAVLTRTLKKLLARHPPADELVCLSFPGHKLLTRFFTLPTLEAKKLPEIMRFEARQQIPFPLDEVIWDWQALGEDSPGLREHDIALLAVKKEVIESYLAPLKALGIRAEIIQSDNIAWHNYVAYEYLSQSGASGQSPGTLAVLDLGTDNTSLIVSSRQSVWVRNMSVGGNYFSNALVKQFNLTFVQAEQLKAKPTAARELSKMYQALEPAFCDLINELQRSLDYYAATEGRARIQKMFVAGGGIKLHGLLKALWHGAAVQR